MARLLITGGTGSFGNGTAKRFLQNDAVSEIIIFSRDEMKQYAMRHEFNHPKLTFVVGDVRDREAIRKATRGVDFIFHAAALKHVPTGEQSPLEMVQTNILGTENVLTVAEENNVKKVVFLSTDKAAHPICAMGTSKAMAEKLMSAHARTSRSTTFCSVRFGNIMVSRGSVGSYFIRLAKANKPLPVTDPAMTRFMLSLDNAIDLVELALAKGGQGDLFIMKAPAVTMGDFAQAIINIFDSRSKIKVTGARPGEKIHETLATSLELARAEDIGDFYRIRDTASLITHDFSSIGLIEKISGDYTSENTERLSVKGMERLLRSLDYIREEVKSYKR